MMPPCLLTREAGALVARPPLDPCDQCADMPCEAGHGCPTYAAADDPADFGDPMEQDPRYEECWPEEVCNA